MDKIILIVSMISLVGTLNSCQNLAGKFVINCDCAKAKVSSLFIIEKNDIECLDWSHFSFKIKDHKRDEIHAIQFNKFNRDCVLNFYAGQEKFASVNIYPLNVSTVSLSEKRAIVYYSQRKFMELLLDGWLIIQPSGLYKESDTDPYYAELFDPSIDRYFREIGIRRVENWDCNQEESTKNLLPSSNFENDFKERFGNGLN